MVSTTPIRIDSGQDKRVTILAKRLYSVRAFDPEWTLWEWAPYNKTDALRKAAQLRQAGMRNVVVMVKVV